MHFLALDSMLSGAVRDASVGQGLIIDEILDESYESKLTLRSNAAKPSFPSALYKPSS